MGFVNHEKGKVFLPRLILVSICEGIIGMMVSLAVLYSGLITVQDFRAQLIVMALTAYVGTDIINSIYKVLLRKRIEL